MKYDIAFLSLLIPVELEDEVKGKAPSLMEGAAIAYQNHIIKGIEAENGGYVRLINVLPIRAFPSNYKDAYIRRSSFSHERGAKDINVGFCNIMLLKRLLQKWPVYREVEKWASIEGNVPKVLIAYTLYPEFLQVIQKIKKRYPNITTISIVVDLPKLITSSKRKISFLSRMYQEWNTYQSMKSIYFIDGFSVVTKQMGERVCEKKPFIIIEGISTQTFPIIENNCSEQVKVLYAGLLFEKFGVIKLLDAFSMIKDPVFQLIICGVGEAEEEIKERARKDDRICYLGNVKREEVLRIMLSCNVIVNPRENVGEFTKYSFPSKNIEALSSGIPFIGYKLDGIPDEYDRYINFPENETIEALSNAIENVGKYNVTEARKKAASAKEWVLSKKDYKTQGKKLISLINQIAVNEYNGVIDEKK